MTCECAKYTMIMHAIIILLLLFVIWKMFGVERLAMGQYVGRGLPNQIYTSGADQRFAQVFSSTDQGVTSTN
jgi:hypothetical protein